MWRPQGRDGWTLFEGLQEGLWSHSGDVDWMVVAAGGGQGCGSDNILKVETRDLTDELYMETEGEETVVKDFQCPVLVT